MTYPTEWQNYNTSVFQADQVDWKIATVCEMAAFDSSGNMVGIPTPYKSYASTTRATLAQFGFVLKWRQVKEYKEPAKKKKDESTYETVTTESYDLEGNLLEKTMENRKVWHNSKGSYIKTRGAGRVFITNPDTMTIRYEKREVPAKVRSIESGYTSKIVVRTVLVPPVDSK